MQSPVPVRAVLQVQHSAGTSLSCAGGHQLYQLCHQEQARDCARHDGLLASQMYGDHARRPQNEGAGAGIGSLTCFGALLCWSLNNNRHPMYHRLCHGRARETWSTLSYCPQVCLLLFCALVACRCCVFLASLAFIHTTQLVSCAHTHTGSQRTHGSSEYLAHTKAPMPMTALSTASQPYVGLGY